MFKSKSLTLAIAVSLAQLASAQDDATIHSIDEVVVTGVRMDSPLELSTNPKAPRQPLPAAMARIT